MTNGTSTYPRFQMVGAREVVASGRPYIEQQVIALEEAVISNPGLAFDLAKTLLESICKTVLSERSEAFDENWDLPKLLKQTLDCLKLVPDGVEDDRSVSDSLRKITGSLQTVIQGICELRNTHGFASHGKGPSFKQLESLHALLVARATDAIVHFIFRVHKDYPRSAPSQPLKYEDNQDFNEFVDQSNPLVQIFDLQYLPSEVLFCMDRPAYEDYLTKFKEGADL